jgi:hypothetical protein
VDRLVPVLTAINRIDALHEVMGPVPPAGDSTAG